MVWTHTQRDVALVQDFKPGSDRPVCQFPRDTMRPARSTITVECAVWRDRSALSADSTTGMANVGLPNPTVRAFLNLGPKAALNAAKSAVPPAGASPSAAAGYSRLGELPSPTTP